MRISFHGAAGGVTGSCHLVEAAGKRILVDCGMFQGSHTLHEDNAQPFGFDPASVDFLLLTHAHLDHCGRIPLLVKRGYQGPIFTTAATMDLARLVLEDSAALQEEDYQRRQRHAASAPRARQASAGNGTVGHANGAARMTMAGARPGGIAGDQQAAGPGDPNGQPLYTGADVALAMDRFQGKMAYGQEVEIAPGIHVVFGNAGHILGSAWIKIEVSEGGKRKRIVFSGDLGNQDKPIINPPMPAPPADYVVMESTYGDRLHKSQADSVKEFQQAVAATLARGGNVVIPTFALERAQDLLYFLRVAVESKVLPSQTPVYLDSPMAISATEIFRRHLECFNSEAASLLRSGHDPFSVPGLHFTRSPQESMAINSVQGGAVIMAGSGMAAGGRILHHLRHNLARKECCVIFVGYAAIGTLARQIIDGAKVVHIMGDAINVAAQICTISGFSAHADQKNLTAWVRPAQAKQIFLVHGEVEASAVLAQVLTADNHAKVVCPQPGQVADL